MSERDSIYLFEVLTNEKALRGHHAGSTVRECQSYATDHLNTILHALLAVQERHDAPCTRLMSLQEYL